MKKKMTLKKIASELGVSISTVSKALHNHPDISKDNQERIQAFAQFHNYRPNSVALSLKNQINKKIGLIIPEIVHYFFAEIIAGAEREAISRGYTVIIGVSNESLEREKMNMEMLAEGSVDGFLISLSKETFLKGDFAHLKEYQAQGIPLVMFDRVTREIDCHKVRINDFESGRKAIELLLESGATKILILSTEGYLEIGNERTAGALSRLEEESIYLEDDAVLNLAYQDDTLVEDNSSIRRAIERALDQYPDTDGIFSVNEISAVTAINVARAKGYDVPKELAVVGFSNGVLSQVSRPALSTLDQHGTRIGAHAAKLLIDQLESKDEQIEFENHVLPTTVIRRGSAPGFSD